MLINTDACMRGATMALRELQSYLMNSACTALAFCVITAVSDWLEVSTFALRILSSGRRWDMQEVLCWTVTKTGKRMMRILMVTNAT